MTAMMRMIHQQLFSSKILLQHIVLTNLSETISYGKAVFGGNRCPFEIILCCRAAMCSVRFGQGSLCQEPERHLP